MTDYGYVFSKALHERLKEKVRAGIFVRSTIDDNLEITIVRSGEDLKFQMTINGLSDKMLHGYSADYAAHEILEKYKRFIINKYFIKEGTR